MPWLDEPTPESWGSRLAWFESAYESFLNRGGGYAIGDQASALLGDVQIAFCAGAWISVVVMALAVVDAQLRETELPDFNGSTQKLLNTLGLGQRLEWLRRRRNELVHLHIERPGISLDQQWSRQPELEGDARKAVELMFEAFFSNPFI